ncbi:MAG: NAD(+) diphosphatase [Christensenellaceae bacterium]|nr:NAD(+) diphosphatase [Christensenellaceae bacterium]
MIQDIFPHVFNNGYHPRPIEEGDLLLCFQGDRLLLREVGEGSALPSLSELKAAYPALNENAANYLFSIDKIGFFAMSGDELAEKPGFCLRDAAIFREFEPAHLAFGGITAVQIWRWMENHRFCGHCGAELCPSQSERALRCPDCGLTEYPRINPAVIVAVTDGDRILLARGKNSPPGRYSLIAGFVEVGETPEDTARREVMEEAGLRVRKLRYFRSQPWSFSDTLLFGLVCELDGPDEPSVNLSELSEAAWFHRAKVPLGQSLISLTQTMIRAFAEGTLP